MVGDSPGELSGCWNDVLNMKKYIMDVHGFEEENIVILMDDGEHTEPTAANIIDAYKTVVSQAEDGDAIFLHYSGEFDRPFSENISMIEEGLINSIALCAQYNAGHGTKIRDDNGDEADGYDEALVPRKCRNRIAYASEDASIA